MRLQGNVVAAITLTLAVASCGSTSPQATVDGGDDASAPDVVPDGGDASAADIVADRVDASVPATASAFCEQVRAQNASFQARCYGGSSQDWRLWNDNYALCADLDRLVAAGTLRYHPERAAACLTAMSADRACFTEDSPCYLETLEGTLAVNASCRDDYECPANAICVTAPPDPTQIVENACLPSVCFPFATKAGDSCVEMDFCVGALTCLQGSCVANLALGQPCGSGLPDCRPGLRCNAASSTCVPRADGGPCQDDQDCVPTSFCGGGRCAPRVAVGSDCLDAATGCVAFAACNPATHICENAGRSGQPCAAYESAAYVCLGGTCEGEVCQPLGAIGAVCFSGADCLSRGCANGACADCPGSPK